MVHLSPLRVLPSELAWYHLLLPCSIIIPSVLGLVDPIRLGIPSFAPRQVIYDRNLIPFFVAPWAAPSSFASVISRLLQVAFLLQFPRWSCWALWRCGLPIWVVIGLVRTLVGFIFTRSLGWAHPSLFRHWALYETTNGFGPILSTLLVLQTAGVAIAEDVSIGTSLLEGSYGVPIALLLTITFCWTEQSPWTYGLALLIAFSIIILDRARSEIARLGRAKYQRVPMYDLSAPSTPDLASTSASSYMTNLGRVIILGLTCFLLMELPFNVARQFTVHPIPMPVSPFPSKPLLEILMLSYPRNDVPLHTSIIKTTLDSYLPFLNSSARLSVYTQSTTHRAMEDVRRLFSTSHPNITFHVNSDKYPDANDGQYLHLSEAFGWVASGRPDKEPAEWVMLIEDDFPMCGGEAGLNGLREVLKLLEASREVDKDGRTTTPRRRAAWVGTGGSGMILHRTWLPILQLVLRAHASVDSKLPEGYARAPDVIIQDCVVGDDPFCATREDWVCPGWNGGISGCGAVITSRQIMDHIGGALSTRPGMAVNTWDWRCGWRNVKHGQSGLEVVPVDW
ncbi:hypothetical protein FA15DRAFT_642618 [Coprinopsis marcescibilis]|uniref:Uncharacterized protein n=1 Tax=Coprinopsis marcescibilis TaxID=230819 RepID=A0A5C3KU43_COPMA|nr:hypothetical protein FA15DRAFT_642618 [Coprinopsis marcescibilis]